MPIHYNSVNLYSTEYVWSGSNIIKTTLHNHTNALFINLLNCFCTLHRVVPTIPIWKKRKYISIVHPGIKWGLWCSSFSFLCSSLYIIVCSLVPFLLFIVLSIHLLCTPYFSIGHISAIDQKLKIRLFFERMWNRQLEINTSDYTRFEIDKESDQ